jgi:4-hydroxy-tetrahydrodipicolinate reductase
MLRIAVSGALGKMGQVLRNEVLKDQMLTYVGGFDRSDAEYVVSNIDALKNVDVLIDFSTPSILKVLLDYAHKHKVALVLATTGYSNEDFELINKYSEWIPIFYSSNYSVGIHLLTKALKLVSQSIDTTYDIEIIDKHHRFKKDAPSGTAFKLFDAVNAGLESKRLLVEGASQDQNIHVHSLRLGNYVGEHQVIFSNLSETLEFSHIAHDKSVFAIGAIKAAKFIKEKEKGLFGMDDLLGEK